jgi:hypothetical protein
MFKLGLKEIGYENVDRILLFRALSSGGSCEDCNEPSGVQLLLLSRGGIA